jgi:pilus assembly protein Flp/PilA
MSRPLTFRSLCKFFRDDGGATAIEYALIASGIAGAIIVAVMTVGTSVQGMYTSVSTGLK